MMKNYLAAAAAAVRVGADGIAIYKNAVSADSDGGTKITEREAIEGSLEIALAISKEIPALSEYVPVLESLLEGYKEG
jgi:hypothetical protein